MPGPQPKPLSAQHRIGVIGDIHTNVDVLEWAIKTLHTEKVELILATGDIPDGPNPGDAVDRCCQLLQQAGALTVIGNHDRWLLDTEMRDLPDATFPDEVSDETRAYFRSLPAKLEIETPLGLLLFGHGLGGDDMATLYPHDHGYALESNAVLQELLREQRYRLLVGGHTHRRMVRVVDSLTVINAGALSRKREPCCVVIDFDAKQVRFTDLGKNGETVPGPTFPL